MPSFKSRNTWIALDMAGCPNRCRHCWVGWHPNRMMSEENLRWVVNLFRNWVRPGDKEPYFEKVDAVTWFREPEFHPDYRKLHELESELNGQPPTRFELLSIWRLAHDESYARWAKEVGAEACQIHFFGTQETNDWFFGRKRECSERYLGCPIGEAESALVSRMLQEEPAFPSAYSYPEEPGFFVTSNFDVFSNIGELAPWWKLGDLKRDSLDSIIDRFEEDKAPGLHAIYNIPASELAQRFGRRNGKRIYSPAELKIRWVRMWCQSSNPHG